MYRKKIAGPLINYTLDDERTMGTKKKKKENIGKSGTVNFTINRTNLIKFPRILDIKLPLKCN